VKKLVAGVGLNDANYVVQKMGFIDGKAHKEWTCPFYQRWVGMLNRCYRKGSSNNRFYQGVTVCDDWLTFSNFRAWLEQQDYNNRIIEKDLMSVFTGKKEYSPENCVMVTHELNTFLMDRYRVRGEWPLGVSKYKRNGKFRATINTVKWKELGYFNTPEEAHKAWQLAKWKYGQELLQEQTDPRVIQAMHVILHKLGEDWSAGRITEKLV
jgi:hypothetical protein